MKDQDLGLKNRPLVTLIITSLLCGLLWRLEVEYHGWEGLIWLSYFHFAVLVGFFLVLYWANLYIELSWKKRLLINVIGIFYGITLYFGLITSLTYIFASGPTRYLLYTQTPEWCTILFEYSIFVFVPLIPCGAYFVLRSFKKKVPVKYLAFSVILLVVSVPVSTMILELIKHKGGSDLIHVIKSGILIPLWVFSTGLVIVGLKKTKIKE